MKKIVHAMLDCFYKNGFGYQENILPAKHKQMGFDVHIITYDQGGDASCKAVPPCTYMNADNIPVHVLDFNKSPLRHIPVIVGWIDTTTGLYDLLEDINPDIIFIHGICIHDNLHFVRYKQQHPEVRIFADNHSDYYNTPIIKLNHKLYRYGVGRYIGKRLSYASEKIWGVTPWRVDYLKEVYGVPSSKTDLLVMGGDDDKIRWDKRSEIRDETRKMSGIPQDAFLIVSGGKIDATKNIHMLTEAVNALSYKSYTGHRNIHLLIFGKIEQDMKDFFANHTNNTSGNIHYVGWISADKAYDYFLASDLACFPGTHSVLWEQACACGLPAIFKDWDGGFSHIDLGGNCLLLKDVSPQTIQDCIEKITSDNLLYTKMRQCAETKARETFSYTNIAKRAINGIKP